LDRRQVIELLKEIIILSLIQPTVVNVRENQGKFELVLKDDYTPALQEFIAKKAMLLRKGDELDVFIICDV